MIRRSYITAAEMAGGVASAAHMRDLEVAGASTDTRTIRPGNLFVPLVAKRDGHEFVEAAFAAGASAAMWQKDRPDPPANRPLILVDDTLEALQRLASAYRSQLPVKVIGITGSNGKTTTKDLTAAVLSEGFQAHKTTGNLNNHIGLPLTLLELEENADLVVLEMGMSGRGEIGLLSRIAKPDIAVITNIGEAHLLQLGSREQIARAKLEIADGLREDGLLLYPGGEPLLSPLLTEEWSGRARLVSFGLDSSNDWHPVGIMQEQEGTWFTTNAPDSSAYYIPLLGEHNVGNSLAAVIIGREFGLSSADIARGLRQAQITGMRFERITTASGITLINDAWNASPASMRAAIRLLAQLGSRSRKFAVLADMLELGGREQEYHQEIGQLMNPETADFVFTCGRLGRDIAAAAEPNYPPGRVRWFAGKEELSAALSAEVKRGDLVLFKGSRGMKLEEVVNALMQQHRHGSE